MSKNEERRSAVQLAALTGVSVGDIHYWAKKGFIKRTAVETKGVFSIGNIPKISLMKKLTKVHGMEALKASGIADEIIELRDFDTEAYNAALCLLDALNKSLTELARLLVSIGFCDAIKETELIDEELIDPIPKWLSKRR